MPDDIHSQRSYHLPLIVPTNCVTESVECPHLPTDVVVVPSFGTFDWTLIIINISEPHVIDDCVLKCCRFLLTVELPVNSLTTPLTNTSEYQPSTSSVTNWCGYIALIPLPLLLIYTIEMVLFPQHRFGIDVLGSVATFTVYASLIAAASFTLYGTVDGIALIICSISIPSAVLIFMCAVIVCRYRHGMYSDIVVAQFTDNAHENDDDDVQ